jgi:hypothetical protein
VSDARQGYLWDIWVSTWDFSINDWGAPVNVGYPVNTDGVEFSAHLGLGERLFFDSSSDPDSLFPFGRYGIYASQWNGSSWSVPELQWEEGSSPAYPSVPADGQWLYFYEVTNIYVSQWMGTGWSYPPYNLTGQLGGRAGSPSITLSGDSLFFTGTPDLGGFGGNDIWLAKRVNPDRVSSIRDENLVILALVLILAGTYWIVRRNVKPTN